jgi:endonuclease-3
MEALTQLPGVGRKTANVIRGTAFGLPAIFVDTHVARLSNRLGLTLSDDPKKIEIDLGDLPAPQAVDGVRASPDPPWTAHLRGA